MRLFLVPVSTRRTLMYAQRLHVTTAPPGDNNYLDRGTAFAARKWSQWEKKESGWQRKVVDYGNQAFRRIPFEEWGLKTVPPLSTRRRDDELRGKEQVELVFPESVIRSDAAEALAKTLASERESLHRKRMLWCFIGMPITIPFALVPIIPNLPFFYLVYRAWSHWKAIAGGKHVQWLVDNKLLKPVPSPILDKLYTQTKSLVDDTHPSTEGPERGLLDHATVRSATEMLDVPGLEAELERAAWQVEQAVAKEDAEKKEK